MNEAQVGLLLLSMLSRGEELVPDLQCSTRSSSGAGGIFRVPYGNARQEWLDAGSK